MITACLITWKRQHNIPRIVEELLKVPEINEILIHDNSRGENHACYRRFELALKVKNDIIYTQDDDCINHDIDKLLGEKGVTCGATDGYMNALDTPTHSNTALGLLGFGSIFHKKDIDFTKYLSKYSKDDLFYREADRIFTLSVGDTTVVRCNIELLDEELGAMSAQPSHLADRQLIIERMT